MSEEHEVAVPDPLRDFFLAAAKDQAEGFRQAADAGITAALHGLFGGELMDGVKEASARNLLKAKQMAASGNHKMDPDVLTALVDMAEAEYRMFGGDPQHEG
jgi:hypothetical protein